MCQKKKKKKVCCCARKSLNKNKKCRDAIVEAKCNVGEVNNTFPESLPRVLILSSQLCSNALLSDTGPHLQRQEIGGEGGAVYGGNLSSLEASCPGWSVSSMFS